MSPCDRAHMTSYWRSIVTMALSRDVSEIFNVEKCHDLEIGVRSVTRGQLRVVSFDRLYIISYFLVTLSIKRTVFWDIGLQKCRDLDNRARGPSRSLEMSPFDRAHMTSYWRSIVTMAQSRVVSEIFIVEKCRDLEIGVKGQSFKVNWEWYHSIDCISFPIFLVTLSLKRAVFEIFDFEHAVTLIENWVRGLSSHWKYQHSVERIRLHIVVP